jgi:hypothetical protein
MTSRKDPAVAATAPTITAAIAAYNSEAWIADTLR